MTDLQGQLLKANANPFRQWRRWLVGVAVLGVVARTVVLFFNRSVFLDEANLAAVILTGTPSEFFAPLPFEQYAPPIFLLLVKGATILGQGSEMVLRFWPWLAGVTGIWLCFRLAQHWFPTFWPRYLVVGGFALAPMLLRYSTEVKQYSTDVWTVLLVLTLHSRRSAEAWQIRDWVLWAVLGVLLPWFSMPSVFLLAGMGGLELFRLYRKQAWSRMIGLILLGGGWLGSFYLYYTAVLRENVGEELLQRFHAPYFFSFTDPGKSLGLLTDLLAMAYGHTALSLILGLGLLVFGIWWGLARQPNRMILLVVPVLLAVLTSAWGTLP